MTNNICSEKKEHIYERAVLVGLITQHQDEEKLTEYLDELRVSCLYSRCNGR